MKVKFKFLVSSDHIAIKLCFVMSIHYYQQVLKVLITADQYFIKYLENSNFELDLQLLNLNISRPKKDFKNCKNTY